MYMCVDVYVHTCTYMHACMHTDTKYTRIHTHTCIHDYTGNFIGKRNQNTSLHAEIPMLTRLQVCVWLCLCRCCSVAFCRAICYNAHQDIPPGLLSSLSHCLPLSFKLSSSTGRVLSYTCTHMRERILYATRTYIYRGLISLRALAEYSHILVRICVSISCKQVRTCKRTYY